MPALFFERMAMARIVSIVAQMAAIAMTDFMKRMSDSLPRCPTDAVHAIRTSQVNPTGATVL
jgi:hypothetical protein